jgi:hypothetical protein
MTSLKQCNFHYCSTEILEAPAVAWDIGAADLPSLGQPLILNLSCFFLSMPYLWFCRFGREDEMHLNVTCPLCGGPLGLAYVCEATMVAAICLLLCLPGCWCPACPAHCVVVLFDLPFQTNVEDKLLSLCLTEGDEPREMQSVCCPSGCCSPCYTCGCQLACKMGPYC